MAAFRLILEQMRIEGESRAGIGTWFRIHPPGLALDAGRGAPELTGAADLFLSHGHLDHSCGLPMVLSQRALAGAGRTRVFCPAAIAGKLADFIGAAAELEGCDYRFRIEALEPGERVAVAADLEVEAFAVAHRVPALGFHLIRTRRRLKEELRGTSEAELARLANSGVELARSERELWLSYCGDTAAEVFELEPRLYETRVLMIECTFFGSAGRQAARDYGHIHLDDLVERRELFRNEVVVLHHLSQRHDEVELESLVGRAFRRAAPRFVVLREG